MKTRTLAAAAALLLLAAACQTEQLTNPADTLPPGTPPADGRLAISRLDIATGATPATRIYTGAPTWETGDYIRVTATAKATGAPIVGYYAYQAGGTWLQEDVWETTDQNPEVVPVDTYPLYIDDIDRTQPIRIDSWGGAIYDMNLVNPDAHYYTDQGIDIEGGYYHPNDHLAAPTATLHTVSTPDAPGAPTRGSLTATLAHQRVDVVVRLITDAAHPIKMDPDGKPNNDLTLLHLALADGNSTGTDGATIRSWIASMTAAAPDAPDAERGKSIVTFRAYVKPADLPAAGADGITPLGTLTYATSVDNNNDGTDITLPGSGKLGLKYKLSSSSSPVQPGTRLTITIDFTRLTGLALSATVSPWTIEEGGEIITQPGRAEADGTQTLDPALFNAQRPVWIVNGGGNPEADLAIATNVRAALDALPATTSNIELTMTGVKTVPENAFPDCTALAALHLPAATSIGGFAFQGCTRLATLSLPAATSIGGNAFDGCTALTAISLPAATSFGGFAFNDCTALTTISLPAATSIGNEVFNGCTSLATVSLPRATSFGGNAFNSCTALSAISLPAATSIGELAFYSCTALTAVSLPVATSIGNNAFQGCTRLATLSLPAATSFGQYAFDGCTDLTTISLPAATSIGIEAFSGCTSLSTIDLPAATSIGEQAFYGCTALTALSLPAATSVGNDAFNGCTSLATVSLPAATIFGSGVFQGCPLTTLSLTAPGSFKLDDGGSFGDFISTACTLTLNADKAKDTGTGSPLVTGADGKSWGGVLWQSITY